MAGESRDNSAGVNKVHMDAAGSSKGQSGGGVHGEGASSPLPTS